MNYNLILTTIICITLFAGCGNSEKDKNNMHVEKQTDTKSIEVSGGFSYVQHTSGSVGPYTQTTLRKVCFEPAQLETINNGNVFCFTNTQEALRVLGVTDLDDSCQRYWGIATIQIKNLTDTVGSISKGDDCVKQGSCSTNQAELVGVTEYFQTATCKK
ncbi:MAG: hypothetical protein HOL80_01030 [Candidatus Magasanikbacteria bacterium]|jgi:hypothetical protein|nr:hypothetical protein [Candidatus Magasanikbacteria bacterium]MBT5262464.1 hypothetical protein [Candidatus Magasanikbacteria bacterium]MBT5820459.1 hypothetical protein [Candidatus Magasanikbacteria bacterium]MBT6294437.1 hypothetical protein [Candidatus Magasanikbacteria bacterium]